MDFTPAVQKLVEETGRIAINWSRGRLEVLAIGDVDNDGELESTPVTDLAVMLEVQHLVDEVIADDVNIDRAHLTLTLPGNVDGSVHVPGASRPMLVMR